MTRHLGLVTLALLGSGLYRSAPAQSEPARPSLRPAPHRITAYAKARDASLQGEDHVKLVLDTFLDGRSGYIFAINPSGARYDALVANQGEGENSNWDAIWDA